MKIKDYFAGKRSRVADWYTQDTSDIPLYCKVTDKVLDMIVTLSDPREASLAVVDENTTWSASSLGVISFYTWVRIA